MLIFISLDLAPGNPLATLSGGRTLSPAAQRVLTHEYHLDQPVLERYWHWLTGALLHANLGTSIEYREPVSSLIGQRIGVTAELVLYAGILIVLFGVGLGLMAGLRRGGCAGVAQQRRRPVGHPAPRRRIEAARCALALDQGPRRPRRERTRRSVGARWRGDGAVEVDRMETSS